MSGGAPPTRRQQPGREALRKRDPSRLGYVFVCLAFPRESTFLQPPNRFTCLLAYDLRAPRGTETVHTCDCNAPASSAMPRHDPAGSCPCSWTRGSLRVLERPPSLPACPPAHPRARPPRTTGRAPAPPARAPTHPRPPRRPTTLAAQTLTPRPIAQNPPCPPAHPRARPPPPRGAHPPRPPGRPLTPARPGARPLWRPRP